MLVNCPECGGKLSTKAKACPHCGYQAEEDLDEIEPELEEEESTETGGSPSPTSESIDSETKVVIALILADASGVNALRSPADAEGAAKLRAICPEPITDRARERAQAWLYFFQAVLRRGYYGGLPHAQTLAGEFFTRDLIETARAVTAFPAWVEAALPKAQLDALMVDAAESMANGVKTEDEIRHELAALSYPTSVVALWVWQRPDRVALRQQMQAQKGAIGRFVEREAEGARRVATGEGCAGQTVSGCNMLWGLLLLVAIIVGLAKSCGG